MNAIPVGSLVALIAGEKGMPVGAVGEVLAGPDHMDDYDVDFPDHPCPVPPGTDWVAHRSWLLPIGQRTELPQQELAHAY